MTARLLFAICEAGRLNVTTEEDGQTVFKELVPTAQCGQMLAALGPDVTSFQVFGEAAHVQAFHADGTFVDTTGDEIAALRQQIIDACMAT